MNTVVVEDADLHLREEGHLFHSNHALDGADLVTTEPQFLFEWLHQRNVEDGVFVVIDVRD